MSLLIKNATVVNADKIINSDILTENGKIIDIAENIDNRSSTIIDATGLLAFPGGIDPHVHLELPTPAGNSSDDFRSGTLAALSGGTTTIIDFVTPSRGESLIKAFEKRKPQAEKSLIDYTLHMGISSFDENTAAEIKKSIAAGITSFKAYLAYLKTIGITYKELREVMQIIAAHNGTLAIHCEDGDEISRLQNKYVTCGCTTPFYHALSRPEYVETNAIAETLKLASETGCRTYIVHVSAKKSIELIEKYKSSGKIFAETCPQYLFLNKTNYDKPLPESLKYVISPPLRDDDSITSLWQHLKSGTIDVVSSDHCPFNTFGQKDTGAEDFTKIPNGAGGIEYRMPLLYKYGVTGGKISLQRFVELTSVNAAKIFGLYPQKGLIAAGSDADIVLWNPETKSAISAKTQFQQCDSNIYEGIPVQGAPEYIICNGVVAFARGKLITEGLKGRFLSRKNP